MILLDRRIGSKELEPHIRKIGAPVDITDLDAGDAAFEGNGKDGRIMVSVERKTLRDLLACMTDGRFAGAGAQLQTMLSRYEHCHLILEGYYRPSDEGILEEYSPKTRTWHPVFRAGEAMKYYALDSYLTSLEASTRLRIRHTGSEWETATVIVSLWHWYQKPWGAHRATQVFYEEGGPGPLVRPSLVRLWAKDLPGVGWYRSAAVEKSFVTAGEMANAPLAKWLTVDGFGKKMATKVIRAIWGEK